MSRQNGFSLIELVIVVAIMGILSAAALPKFTEVSSHAKRETLISAETAWNSAAKNITGQAMLEKKEKNSVLRFNGKEFKLSGLMPYLDAKNLDRAMSTKLAYKNVTTKNKNENGFKEGTSDEDDKVKSVIFWHHNMDGEKISDMTPEVIRENNCYIEISSKPAHQSYRTKSNFKGC